MGAAALPTYTLNGQKKQMYSYAGSKAIGVNPNAKNMEAGGEKGQKLHYELRNVIPCNKKLLEDKDILSDLVVAAQTETFDKTSVLQPFVPKMSNCWVPVENMGKGIRNGSVTHENAEEQVEAMNKAMNSDGI